MRVTINGEARSTEATCLLELVENLQLDMRQVAVERNLSIIPRSLYAQTLLAEGDRIEIVRFIGGG